MIKRFHALYVGQIDLDNVGLDGTPANDRRYSSARLAEVFETSRRVAQVTSRRQHHNCGTDQVWVLPNVLGESESVHLWHLGVQ